MPVRKVKGGYKWGKTGKIYPTKEQAEKQGIAIKISENKRKKKNDNNKLHSHHNNINRNTCK